jgi:putative (di)nucleoside polyphosphate hydrolase
MERSGSKKRRSAGARHSGRTKPRPNSVSTRASVVEPDLVMLLGEPEIRLLMRADHVDESELRAMLEAIAVQLRDRNHADAGGGRDAPRTSGVSGANYRQGVGIVLFNQGGGVFVGRRADVKEDAWQMPQGGIDPGESPEQAALRELKEEIGTDKVEVLAESKGWLYYDVPSELAQKAWGRQWRGQRQKWFAMLFKGQDTDIDVATEHPEFNAWRWVSSRELSALAVSFKRQLYLSVLGEFPTLFRD